MSMRPRRHVGGPGDGGPDFDGVIDDEGGSNGIGGARPHSADPCAGQWSDRLARAVAAAEQALSGRAVEAELDAANDRLIYEVELVRNATLHVVAIDARTGRLVSTGARRWETLWRSWFDPGFLQPSGRPLASILAAIEAETGGRLREIRLDTDGGQPIYEVEIATAAGVAEILVDPVTGRRLAPRLDDEA